MEKVLVLLLLLMVGISFERILQEPEEEDLSGDDNSGDNFKYKEEEEAEEAENLHRADFVSENTDNRKDLFEINLEHEEKYGVIKVKGLPGSHVDQGDILFDECEEEKIFGTSGNMKNPKCKDALEIARKKLKSRRKAEQRTTIPNYEWPNPVPYLIDWYKMGETMEEIVQFRRAFLAAVAEISNKSCLKFKEKNNEDKDYLKFVKGNEGCYTGVGKKANGAHVITLTTGCYYMKPIAHEMMHALGFWHEQSRHDRDNFLTVNYENIEANMTHNFDIALDQDDYGYRYDYKSIMHYPRIAFGIVIERGINGEPIRRRETMTPNDQTIQELGNGENDGLSIKDALQLNERYCNKPKSHVDAIELQELIKRWLVIYSSGNFKLNILSTKLELHLKRIYPSYVFMVLSGNVREPTNDIKIHGDCDGHEIYGIYVVVCYTQKVQPANPPSSLWRTQTASKIQKRLRALNGNSCEKGNIIEVAKNTIIKLGDIAGVYIQFFRNPMASVWSEDANGVVIHFRCEETKQKYHRGTIMVLFRYNTHSNK